MVLLLYPLEKLAASPCVLGLIVEKLIALV
jgi:hypothetical protein